MSENTQERIASLVGDQGIVIARKSDVVMDSLQSAGFNFFDVGRQVILATRPLPVTSLQGRNAFILVSLCFPSFPTIGGNFL